MTCVRVLIVDDHPMVRAGLAKFLSAGDEVEVVGEAADGSAAVAACARLHPDVVLMDLLMPTMDGAEATARIKAESPEVQVVAVSSFVQGDLVRRALDAGIVGFVLKDAEPESLLRAVRDAREGRGAVDSAALKALSGRRPGDAGGDLTPRELDVLGLLAKGLTNDAISAELGIGAGTVRQHVSSILAKLDAPNRTTAVLIALERRLVEHGGGMAPVVREPE